MKTDGFQFVWDPSDIKAFQVGLKNSNLNLNVGIGNGKPEWRLEYKVRF